MEIREIKEDLDKFEQLIKAYNFEYTNYFCGNIKFPPVTKEREINKIIRKYNLVQITNATLRFRFNNLVAKYLTFKDKWNRKMMEREGIKRTYIKSQVHEEVYSNEAPKKNFSAIDKELEKLPESYNKDKIKRLINKKIEDMKKKGFEEFDVKIDIVDGKPKLMIRPKI